MDFSQSPLRAQSYSGNTEGRGDAELPRVTCRHSLSNIEYSPKNFPLVSLRSLREISFLFYFDFLSHRGRKGCRRIFTL